jgi:hypothetical protein
MRNYCTPHIIKENVENFLIHRCNYILLSQVYCVWQVVTTPTVISNNSMFLQTPYNKAVWLCNETSSCVLRNDKNRSTVKPLNILRYKKLKLKILSEKKSRLIEKLLYLLVLVSRFSAFWFWSCLFTCYKQQKTRRKRTGLGSVLFAVTLRDASVLDATETSIICDQHEILHNKYHYRRHS